MRSRFSSLPPRRASGGYWLDASLLPFLGLVHIYTLYSADIDDPARSHVLLAGFGHFLRFLPRTSEHLATDPSLFSPPLSTTALGFKYIVPRSIASSTQPVLLCVGVLVLDTSQTDARLAIVMRVRQRKNTVRLVAATALTGPI